ncbi:MAG: BamA/TamA family outer membrane protein, partial [Alistipes sp.]
MKRFRWVIILVLLGFFSSACTVTRHFKSGEYLLQKVQIEDDKQTPKAERITASELKRYMRQSPNKHFFGTNFYIWVYNLANPDKENWWNNFKRKIGQAPVILDRTLTEKSADNFKAYMDSRGFFASQATFEIDTLSKHKKARVTYRTKQGEPYRINRLTYDFRDAFLPQIILPDTAHTLIRTGNVFDIGVLNKERERITAYLQQRGYFNFSVNNIEYVADTLVGHHQVDVKMVIKQYLVGYDNRGEAIMDNNTVYRIDEINIFPNYNPTIARTDSLFLSKLDTIYYRGLNVIYEKKPNVRAKVLRQAVPLYPNYIYNADQINRTYNELMSLGYFKSAKIAFKEQPQQVESKNYVTYIGQEGLKDSTQTEYAREGFLQCDILCTPALKQSFKVDLEGSITSSFYGLSTTVGYQNRNIFRGAEAFDASVTVGYESMRAPNAKKRSAMEFGATVGLSFPRFLLPFNFSRFPALRQPKTKVEFTVNFQDRPYYRRVLSGVGLSYSWINRNYSSYLVRPIDFTIVDVSYMDTEFFNSLQNEYLKNSYRSQLIAGITFNYVFNNQRKHLGRNATVVRVNAETAGNLLDGLEHLFAKPVSGHSYYELFGIRYSQYFRVDVSVSRKIMLGTKCAIVGRLFVGGGLAYGNATSIPMDRLFYVGGSNSMRGWTPRTLGPGSSTIPEGQLYPTQLGDMRLEANLELRFPIWGIIHGATFLDAGNIWFVRNRPLEYSPDAVFHFDTFYKQLGFNTGIGLRVDIKFAVLRLDWGIQLHNPNNPEGERWIHNFKWKNTALNFG